jgi:hypothetical protein
VTGDRAVADRHGGAAGATAPGDCGRVHAGDVVRRSAAGQCRDVGINPSSREFVGDDGLLLTGDLRRLATTDSIGVAPGRELSVEQARAVVEDCNGYFARNPYRRWFNRLDRVLTSALGVGYHAGTACHLDLIQWATDPAWGQLHDRETKRLLLEEGRPHLQALLALANLRVVVLNGQSVIDHVTQLGLCPLEEVARVKRDRDTCRLVLGQREEVTYVGWTTNLQSSRGVSRRFLDELTGTVRTLLSQRGAMPEPAPVQQAPPAPLGRHSPRVARQRRTTDHPYASAEDPPARNRSWERLHQWVRISVPRRQTLVALVLARTGLSVGSRLRVATDGARTAGEEPRAVRRRDGSSGHHVRLR